MCRSVPDVVDEERDSNELSPFVKLGAAKSDRPAIEGFHVANASTGFGECVLEGGVDPGLKRHPGIPIGCRRTDHPVDDRRSSTGHDWRGWIDASVVASSITFRHTDAMGKAISVRLDNESERALHTLESSGMTRSEAIRSSLLASAARLRHGHDLAAEAAALEADETDRTEMLAVAELMESLRAPR